MVCSSNLSEEYSTHEESMVARCLFFKPKIPIWVNFGGPLNGKCWYILLPFRIFNGHLVCIVCGHWFYFSHLVCLDKEKSGNPGQERMNCNGIPTRKGFYNAKQL
jgi:hypothetical protein